MDDRLHSSKFIPELIGLCPLSFVAAGRAAEYGQKFHLANGCILVISWKADRLVSKFHSESGFPPIEVIDAALALAERYTDPLSRRRRELTERLLEWRSTMSSEVAVVANARRPEAGPTPDDCVSHPIESEANDPIGVILPTGTIRVSGRARGRDGQLPAGLGGPSGWSQAIGQRCERFAFDWIAGRFGSRCTPIAGRTDQVRLRMHPSDRILVWLNAHGEQGNSWDLEERDAATMATVRMHEVKAPSAALTDAESELATRYGDDYIIWRVDPDQGECDRVELRGAGDSGTRHEAMGAGRAALARSDSSSRNSEADPDAPTMVILGSSTREFCRRLRRQHRCVVGRFRRNLVVAFEVTPELEARLPPSASKLWIANRSRAGCDKFALAKPSRIAKSMVGPRGLLWLIITSSGGRGLATAVNLAEQKLSVAFP